MENVRDELLLDQRVRFTELFDIYRGLLTDKQREACDVLLGGDLTIAELGEELRMTRQGANDLIRRSREALEDIEKMLGLLDLTKRFESLEQLLEANREKLPADFLDCAERLFRSEVTPGV